MAHLVVADGQVNPFHPLLSSNWSAPCTNAMKSTTSRSNSSVTPANPMPTAAVDA